MAETPGQADPKLFHWQGTWDEFDAEVRRRWIESSGRLGLDHGMPNAAAAIAAQQQPALEPPFPGDPEPVMTPAVTRPYFGSVHVLAVGEAPDDSVSKLQDVLTAASEGVTVVTVRGVDALRTWEPQPASELDEVKRKLSIALGALRRIDRTNGTVVDQAALWGIVREAIAKVTDVDGQLMQTAPGLAAMAGIDPVKLDLLADWFDLDDAVRGRLGNPEVQADLRRWAKIVRDVLAGLTS